MRKNFNKRVRFHNSQSKTQHHNDRIQSQCFFPRSPLPFSCLHHLDHLFADSHELVVELGVAHLHLLQSEDPLVAALAELLLLLLQTLNHLSRSRGPGRVKTRTIKSGGKQQKRTIQCFYSYTTLCIPYLSVTKCYVGTQTTDVWLAGLVQLWFQPNIFGLNEREKKETLVFFLEKFLQNWFLTKVKVEPK